MKISVVVSTHNASRTISKCLKSLLNQTIPKKDYEIIVILDACTDNSYKIVSKYKGVRLLRTKKNLFISACRNLGLNSTSGEIVAFIDADCYALPTWIQTIIEDFDQFNIGMIYGKRMARTLSKRWLRARDLKYIFNSGKYNENKKRLFTKKSQPYLVSGHNMAIKRNVFDLVGLFSEEYGKKGCEDIDFQYRLLKEFDILFDPMMIVIHDHPHTIKAQIDKSFRYGRGEFLLEKSFGKDITKCNWISSYMPKQVKKAFSNIKSKSNKNFNINKQLILELRLTEFLDYIARRIGYFFESSSHSYSLLLTKTGYLKNNILKISTQDVVRTIRTRIF